MIARSLPTALTSANGFKSHSRGFRPFEAASLETDETLQDMWAELLANAMDPSKDTSLQRVFIETLKQIEPIEARIFQNIAQSPDKAVRSDVQLMELIDLGILRIRGASAPQRYTPTPLGTELHLACSPNGQD